MKTVNVIVLVACMLMLGTNLGFSQRGGHGHAGHHGGARVVVKNHHRGNRVMVRSVYRPAKIGMYYPHWRPNYGYHRRWVYFPRHNFYWDNWRQGYYYRNGTVWIFNTTPPPTVVNINLAEEKNYELKEDQDDVDDVYKTPNPSELKTDSVK